MDPEKKTFSPQFHQAIRQIYPQYSKELLEQYLSDSEFNYGLGSIMGAALGDALGSYVQFKTQLKKQVVEKALQMPGGGTWSHILPGQFTDDTQIAAHLLQGLLQYNPQLSIEQQKTTLLKNIGIQYDKWLNSFPFDKGNTISTAFRIINSHKLQSKNTQEQINQTLQSIYKNIHTYNEMSQSNGSLMRITPLALFGGLIKNNQGFKDFVTKQIKLSHSNLKAIRAGEIYVNALVDLIKRKNDNQDIGNIYQNTIVKKAAQETLLKDYFQKQHEQQLIQGSKNMGWALIAWSMTFNKLRQIANNINSEHEKYTSGQHYKEVMRDVMLKCGDTDTNCAIVGGMLGAVIGFKKLPIQYLEKAISINFKKSPETIYTRTIFYQPRSYLVRAMLLYKKIKK